MVLAVVTILAVVTVLAVRSRRDDDARLAYSLEVLDRRIDHKYIRRSFYASLERGPTRCGDEPNVVF